MLRILYWKYGTDINPSYAPKYLMASTGTEKWLMYQDLLVQENWEVKMKSGEQMTAEGFIYQ